MNDLFIPDRQLSTISKYNNSRTIHLLQLHGGDIMKTIYIYVLDTLADWEIGYITSELHSKRFFKKEASPLSIKTVSHSKEPIYTMGGLRIVPDLLTDEMVVTKENTLLLPGGDTWNDSKHQMVLKKANEFLFIGATVGAICGATAALADQGVLDHRPHTSNGLGFLEMLSPHYKGHEFYVEQPSVSSNHLITANATAALLWTKHILERLDVFNPDTLDAWYNYFNTGEAIYFFELMQTLPNKGTV